MTAEKDKNVVVYFDRNQPDDTALAEKLIEAAGNRAAEIPVTGSIIEAQYEGRRYIGHEGIKQVIKKLADEKCSNGHELCAEDVSHPAAKHKIPYCRTHQLTNRKHHTCGTEQSKPCVEGVKTDPKTVDEMPEDEAERDWHNDATKPAPLHGAIQQLESLQRAYPEGTLGKSALAISLLLYKQDSQIRDLQAKVKELENQVHQATRQAVRAELQRDGHAKVNEDIKFKDMHAEALQQASRIRDLETERDQAVGWQDYNAKLAEDAQKERGEAEAECARLDRGWKEECVKNHQNAQGKLKAEAELKKSIAKIAALAWDIRLYLDNCPECDKLKPARCAFCSRFENSISNLPEAATAILEKVEKWDKINTPINCTGCNGTGVGRGMGGTKRLCRGCGGIGKRLPIGMDALKKVDALQAENEKLKSENAQLWLGRKKREERDLYGRYKRLQEANKKSNATIAALVGAGQDVLKHGANPFYGTRLHKIFSNLPEAATAMLEKVELGAEQGRRAVELFDECKKLQTEVERLRGALGEIANAGEAFSVYTSNRERCINIAQKALAGEKS